MVPRCVQIAGLQMKRKVNNNQVPASEILGWIGGWFRWLFTWLEEEHGITMADIDEAFARFREEEAD